MHHKVRIVLLACFALTCCQEGKKADEPVRISSPSGPIEYIGRPYATKWVFSKSNYARGFPGSDVQGPSLKRTLCANQQNGEICGVANEGVDKRLHSFLRLSIDPDAPSDRLRKPSTIRYRMGKFDCLSFQTVGWDDKDIGLEYRNTFQFCETIGVFSFTTEQFQDSDGHHVMSPFYLSGESGLLADCQISSSVKTANEVGETPQGPWLICPNPG